MINKMPDIFTILEDGNVFNVSVDFNLEPIYIHADLNEEGKNKFFNYSQGGKYKNEQGEDCVWFPILSLYNIFKESEKSYFTTDMEYWKIFYDYLKDNNALEEFYSEAEEVYELITGVKLVPYCEVDNENK